MRLFHCTAVYGPNSFIIRCVIFCIFAAVQAVTVLVYLLPLFKTNSKSSSVAFIVLISIWGFLSLLWIWSYIVTCWMDAGSVENELYKRGLVNKEGKIINEQLLPPEIASIPRCNTCHLPKPYRTHHCSQCEKCYFRFDHHCDVIGNCIAYKNMKSFMLLLFYSSLLLFISAIISIVSYTMTEKVDLSYILVSCLFGILIGAVICIFGCMYVPEVCVNNRTTLERIAGNDPKFYDAGMNNNIKQVFGECPLLWIFPTRPSVDGFTWSSVYDHDSQLLVSTNRMVLLNVNNTYNNSNAGRERGDEEKLEPLNPEEFVDEGIKNEKTDNEHKDNPLLEPLNPN